MVLLGYYVRITFIPAIFLVGLWFLRQLLSEVGALAEKLTSGTWTHDYPITVQEAQEWGLPVSTDVPQEVYDLMALYPRAAKRRPSVQYIPVPYRREERRPSSKR